MKSKKTQIARHLRQQQTPAESTLWDILRNRNFENLKFRRQHPLKEYIVDFYCDELELIIALDGGYHSEKVQKYNDGQRDYHLNFLGYRVLRYKNAVVFNDIGKIYTDIKKIQSQTESHFKKTQINKANSKNKSESSPFSEGEGLGMRGSTIIDEPSQIKILSTKKLKPNQRDLLLGAGFSLVDYNAIEIEFLDFEIPSNIENAIFTSQNGVRSFLKQTNLLHPSRKGEGLGTKISRVFCVGQKTKVLLEENGLKVTKMNDYGSELADFIVKNRKNEVFYFFCGTKRRDEIPNTLKTSKIDFSEVKTYKTSLKPRKFDQKWDGILFFSPSGVESFVCQNNLKNTIAFCIGKTTATEAQKYTSNVVVANTTSVESVIAKAVKTLNSH